MIEQHTGIEGAEGPNTCPGGGGGPGFPKPEVDAIRLTSGQVEQLGGGSAVHYETRRWVCTAWVTIATTGSGEEVVVSPALKLLQGAGDRQPLDIELTADMRATLATKTLRVNLPHNVLTDKIRLSPVA